MPLADRQWKYFAIEGVRYHGHLISIIFDRDGSRYRMGSGLRLYVDGNLQAENPRIRPLVVYLGKERRVSLGVATAAR